VVGYKKTVLMLLSMFFIMTFYISSWAKDTKSLIDQKQFSNFLTHFRLVKHVHLDFDNLIIGNIELFLPINNNYVIYDQMADSLYEIDPAQKSYHNIDIEEKLPGKHWSALGITACGETSYIVSSASNYFLQIQNGHIVNKWSSEKYRASYKIGCFNNNLYFMNFPTPQHAGIVRLDLKSRVFEELFELDDYAVDYRNVCYRSPKNGAFVCTDKGILISNAFENLLYRYDYSGKLLNKFPGKYKNFKQMQRDLRNDKDAILAFFMQKKKKPVDMQFYSALLDDGHLLMSYVIDNKLYLEIKNIDTGQPIHKEAIECPFPFLYAEKGNIYLTGPPSAMDAQGNFGNQSIIVFDYVQGK